MAGQRSTGTVLFAHLWTAWTEIPLQASAIAFAPMTLIALVMAFMRNIKPQVELIFNHGFVQQSVEIVEHETMTTELGDYIKSRLRAIKKTQGWIAEQLDVSDNAVSKWIKTGKISRSNFIKLLPLLGGKPPLLGDFIEGEAIRVDVKTTPLTIFVKTPRPPTVIEELVRIVGSISADGVKALMSYAYHVEKEHPAQAKQTPESSA